jgi:hypothetical protein
MNNLFKTPMYYNKHKCQLPIQITTELELLTTQNPEATPVFLEVFTPSNAHSKDILGEIVETYTTDIQYLKDTQSLVKKYTKTTNVVDDHYDSVVAFMKDITDDSFTSKYCYVEYTHFSFLNQYSSILQMLSIYTIMSPVVALLTPLIVMIVPYIILNMGVQPIDFQTYMTVLREIGKSNPLIGLVTEFGTLNQEQRLYQIMTLVMYIFTIYRQCMDCYTFISNFIELTHQLVCLKEYLVQSLQNMRHFVSFTYQLKTYDLFNQSLSQNVNDLIGLTTLLENIHPFTTSIQTGMKIGNLLKIAHTLHTNKHMQSNIHYAIRFNAFIEIFEKIAHMFNTHKLGVAIFKKQRAPKLKFKQLIYPYHVNNSNTVANDVTLSKNLIITGPNASGKTTLLKSVFVNLLFSQQYGVGFYKRSVITPFKYLHCYINVPDTNGRDSLFQAEARRCKQMLDSIQSNVDGKHFCVFDELYSGTNPEEAVHSSTQFLKYITERRNVKWILTTHFIDLCKQLDTHKDMSNCHMKVTSDYKHTYKIEPGFSTIRGAFRILAEMNFPKEICNSLI